MLRGDRVAILSPSFAAPGFAPSVHEQAMRRLVAETGLIPVEYATTRTLNSSPEARAADINAAFADRSIRAIFATVGGDDQILVIPHLSPEIAVADPKPFFGYSDNTNLLNWLWSHGVGGYYGGSTQIHLGAGLVWIAFTLPGCELHSLTVASLTSLIRGSQKISGQIGCLPKLSSALVHANPPNHGVGQGQRALLKGAHGVGA